MRFQRMKWAVGSLGLSMLLLAACSNGGGGGAIPATSGGGGLSTSPGSIMTITTKNAAGTKTTFTANASNSIITAHTNAQENKTVIEICSDVDKDNDCSRLMIMTIDGTAAANYAMVDQESLSQIMYHDEESEKGILAHYVSDDGDIEVSSIDASGSGDVKGTFKANLACNSGCSGVIAVSGTYDIALNR